MCGSPVSSSIVLAAAKGIVIHKNQSVLKEFDGSVELIKSWAFSFLHRCGYVKRKSTRTSRKIPDDFDEIKVAFLERVSKVVQANNIPLSMSVNFDQTGTKIVTASEWTIEIQGTKQIDVVGLDDKQEVTTLLAISLSGNLLPPQVIYARKTERCHPNVNVPTGWNVTPSETHWSTKYTMLEYNDMVLAPYMTQQSWS